MEVDTPLVAVQRSIQNVEEQIKDVEEQIKDVEEKIKDVEDRLEKEQDPDEKKYFQKKKKQLRKEEEQLRKKEEQLRKKEEQLWEEKLLLLKSTDQIQQRPIAKDAYDVCYEFWELLKSKFGSMPTEKDFKRSYLRSSTEICTLQNRPVLLLQGLSEGHYFDASKAVLAEFDRTGRRLGFLVDASGSGKTRTLYEICVRTGFSLYLSGVTDSGLTDSGSRDLQEVAKKLEALYPGTGEIPLDASLACFGALLVSRLFILAQCLREGTAVTPLAWLFKQVYFRHLNYAVVDPWLELTSRLLSLIRTPSSIGDWRHLFVDILVDLKAVTKWDGVVIIDECQQLSRLLENRFMSDTTKQLKLSLLDKAYLCLDLMGFGKRVLISGTGRKLITLQDSYFTFTQFGDFSTPQAVESYTRGIVRDVEDFDFARIIGLYTGRYRIYVTVLEMFLRDSQQEPGLQATGYFTQRFSKLSSLTGVELGINRSRSIWDDVVKFFEVPNLHPECLDSVSQVALCIHEEATEL